MVISFLCTTYDVVGDKVKNKIPGYNRIISLAEVEVIVDPSNEYIPINVALFSHGGFEHQSSTYLDINGTWGAYLANDINSNGDYNDLIITLILLQIQIV